jgi:hypothetical protein
MLNVGGMSSVVSLLLKWQAPTLIAVAGNGVGDAGVQALAESLGSNRTLTILRLYGACVQPASIVTLFRPLCAASQC